MVRIVTQDTSRCSDFLTNTFFMLTEFIVLSLVVSFLFYINKIVTIILVILFGCIFLVIFKILKPRLKVFAKNNQKYHAGMIKWIQQSLGAIKDIKILQKEQFFINKYYDSSVKFTSAQKHFRFLEQFPRLLIESFVVSVILSVIIYLLYKGIDASTIIIQMAVFAMAAFRLMPSMNRLQVALNALMYFMPSINVVYRDLKNTRVAGYLENDQNKKFNMGKDICVNNISYKYPNTEKYIFEDVSFNVKRGTSIGFVGPTGAGKTYAYLQAVMKSEKQSIVAVPNSKLMYSVADTADDIGIDYITTPIIMGLFESHVPLLSITIMVQKEVADRMKVGPGTKDYGALSLAVQYYAKPYIAANVPQNCFMPRPNVGSAVIRLTKHEKPPVQVKDEAFLFRIIRASFNQRRKTLANGLCNEKSLSLTRENVTDALRQMELSETIRGEALTLEQFAKLSDLLKK